MAVPLSPPTSKDDNEELSYIASLLLLTCGVLVCGHGIGVLSNERMDVCAAIIFCLFVMVALAMLVKEFVYPSPVVHYVHHVYDHPPPYSVREAAARISCPN